MPERDSPMRQHHAPSSATWRRFACCPTVPHPRLHLPRRQSRFYLGLLMLQRSNLVLDQGEIGTMETKPAQNIQDTFLNTARKDKSPITIYLMSGVKLSGRIRSFDKYSVVLETNNQEQLIFKHAISTVVMGRGVHHPERPGMEHRPPSSERAAGAAH